jgi:homospermidine synthase
MRPATAPAKEKKKKTAVGSPEASGSPMAKPRAIAYHGKVALVDLSAGPGSTSTSQKKEDKEQSFAQSLVR